ncbi:MAG: hypothetical protein ABI187_09860, partial [Ornithinibacter sp.]
MPRDDVILQPLSSDWSHDPSGEVLPADLERGDADVALMVSEEAGADLAIERALSALGLDPADVWLTHEPKATAGA